MPQNKKHLPLWPAVILLIIVVFFLILNLFCRYFYTKNFVSQCDRQLAEMLAQELETAGITNLQKPIFFFGCADTRTNGSCLDLSTGKYDIFSAFAVKDALNLNTIESSRYIVSYLNNLGYSYTAPTEANMEAYQTEIDASIPLEKTFPWYDSVLETEHCILVQLSDSYYDLYLNPKE